MHNKGLAWLSIVSKDRNSFRVIMRERRKMDNNFEAMPGEFVPNGEENRELGPTEGDFKEAMKGAEEAEWDMFGNRVEKNEVQNDKTESEAVEDIPLVNKADEMMNGNEYNQGIADAAAIINYGLNAAARERGVEPVVQGIKKFVVTGSNDVIGDLFRSLGIDTPAEMKELREEARATRTSEEAFLAEQGVQGRGRYSNEGAIAAINSMKELITEVEGNDPRFNELRQGAQVANMGYFEYAVKVLAKQEDNDKREDLTTLFKVLAEQKEKVVDNNGVVEGPKTEAEKQEEYSDEQLNPEIVSPPDLNSNDFSGEQLDSKIINFPGSNHANLDDSSNEQYSKVIEFPGLNQTGVNDNNVKAA